MANQSSNGFPTEINWEETNVTLKDLNVNKLVANNITELNPEYRDIVSAELPATVDGRLVLSYDFVNTIPGGSVVYIDNLGPRKYMFVTEAFSSEGFKIKLPVSGIDVVLNGEYIPSGDDGYVTVIIPPGYGEIGLYTNTRTLEHYYVLRVTETQSFEIDNE